jgi:uncharacterized protein
MRISAEEHQAITQAVYSKDPLAQAYLFGSRADDARKGGDIDVLLLSKKINLLDKIDILTTLHRQLGQRKIDLIIYDDDSRPFPKLALQTGVRL